MKYFFPSHHVAVYVFSQEEVEKVVSLLQEQARTLSRYGMKKHLRILPMYSGLPYADQMKVFERAPSSVRKVSKPHCFHACKEKCMKTFFHELKSSQRLFFYIQIIFCVFELMWLKSNKKIFSVPILVTLRNTHTCV